MESEGCRWTTDRDHHTITNGNSSSCIYQDHTPALPPPIRRDPADGRRPGRRRLKGEQKRSTRAEESQPCANDLQRRKRRDRKEKERERERPLLQSTCACCPISARSFNLGSCGSRLPPRRRTYVCERGSMGCLPACLLRLAPRFPHCPPPLDTRANAEGVEAWTLLKGGQRLSTKPGLATQFFSFARGFFPLHVQKKARSHHLILLAVEVAVPGYARVCPNSGDLTFDALSRMTEAAGW
ncbi:hypothetical protein B0I35DRAFT_71147 [Stachybotrys elegans]|uniref:Uncharacterized protein n=1 Tax=Stachybotrys elegans TaxID=80388 RepID=A0A8K0SLL9_9HYPO|nr:hypothetical protein B0I35DRAFT_71147 [Stachybotrys elegans]